MDATKFCVLALGLLLSSQAFAQSWPTRPVRVIVSATGSAYDIAMRGLAVPVGQALGQPMVVENRPGGNFIAQAEACLRSGTDGYTLCTANAYMNSINPYIYPKLSYNPARDFAPVIHWGYLKGGLIVHPSVQASTPAELFALAKANPGKMTFGTPGPATLPSMMIEYLKRSANVSFTNIPYKSFIQSATAVVSGEVQVGIVAIGQASAFAKAGRAKLLSTAGPTRSTFVPSLPALADFGVDLDLDSYGGVVAPAGTPREVIARLNAEIRNVMAQPGVKEKYLESQGFEQGAPSGGTPEEFGAFLRQQDAKYAKLIPFIGGLTDVVNQ